MEVALTSTTDWVAAVIVLAPVVAAFGGIWIKGALDRNAEHRAARRQAYAEFMAATRIVAMRSTQYQAERSIIGALVASFEDSGPVFLGAILLALKHLRRGTTSAERVGLLSLLPSPPPPTRRTEQARLFDALEDLQRSVSMVRIVGSRQIISDSDDVLGVSRKILEAAQRTYGLKHSDFASELKGLANDLDTTLNRFVGTARSEFPGL